MSKVGICTLRSFLLIEQYSGPSSRCDHASWYIRLELKGAGDFPHSKWKFSWGETRTTDHRILPLSYPDMLFYFFQSLNGTWPSAFYESTKQTGSLGHRFRRHNFCHLNRNLSESSICRLLKGQNYLKISISRSSKSKYGFKIDVLRRRD